MADTPKRIKRLLREHAAAAHEEELRRALAPVAEAFKRWERGELGSGELSEIIHRFHQGPARELFARYNTPYLEMIVAYAITVGVLDRQRFQPDSAIISLVRWSSTRVSARRREAQRPHAAGGPAPQLVLSVEGIRS